MGEFPGGPVLRLSALISRAQVQSLDREERFCKSHAMRKKKKTSKDNLELSLLARANQVSGHRHELYSNQLTLETLRFAK